MVTDGAYGSATGREALGYSLVEEERPGRFDPGARRGARGAPGPQFGLLQKGEPVEAGGRVVQPDDVMGESRPGRKVVVTGDTEPCESTVACARGAELLVHDGTFAEEEVDRARQTGHSTARQAAEVARAAEVSMLALSHLSSQVLRARDRAGGARLLRGRDRAAGLRRDRGALSRAG